MKNKTGEIMWRMKTLLWRRGKVIQKKIYLNTIENSISKEKTSQKFGISTENKLGNLNFLYTGLDRKILHLICSWR